MRRNISKCITIGFNKSFPFMVLHKRISSDEQFEKQRKDPRTGYEEFVKIVKVGLLSLVQICTI